MQNRKRDTNVQNRILESVGEGKGGMFRQNSIKTCILSRVKQIASPGWMHETSARGWYTGKTQRDGMGREEGGSGRGTHVNPWLIHVNAWQKPLQQCKAISLQLIKINGGGETQHNHSPNTSSYLRNYYYHKTTPICPSYYIFRPVPAPQTHT